MFLTLPLAFAEKLDTSAVDQQLKPSSVFLSRNCDGDRVLSAAERAEIRHLLVQNCQFDQAFDQADALPQHQAKQAFDGQAELDGCIAEGCRAAGLA